MHNSCTEKSKSLCLKYITATNLAFKLWLGVFLWRLCVLQFNEFIYATIVLYLLNAFGHFLRYLFATRFKNIDFITCVRLLLLIGFKNNEQNFKKLKYKLIQALENFYHLPLSMITFYAFRNVLYLRYSTENTNGNSFKFDYYFLYISSVFLSINGVYNSIVIDKINSCEDTNSSLADIAKLEILFSSLFRYFQFAAKMLSIVLTLASSLTYWPYLISYIAILFISYAFIFLFEMNIHINLTSKYSIKFSEFSRSYLAEAIFHASRMTINFDEKFLRFSFKLYEKKELCSAERFYTRVKITLFTCLNLISNGVMAYFWYYDATLNENSYLAILIQNSTIKLSIFNFEYEEEKIRFKQIVLVFICGASLVSLLSFHIFYNFYCQFSSFGEILLINDNSATDRTNKSEQFNNSSSAKKKNKNENFILTISNELFDNYEAHGYYTDTTTDTSSTTNLSSKDRSQLLRAADTSIPLSTNDSSTNYSADSFTNSMKSLQIVKSSTLRQQCAESVENSSGVSTVTSCNLSYDQHFVDDYIIHDKNASNGTALKTQNLFIHNQKTNQSSQQSTFYERVYLWFTKTNFSSSNLQPPIQHQKQQQHQQLSHLISTKPNHEFVVSKNNCCGNNNNNNNNKQLTKSELTNSNRTIVI